MGRKKGVSTEPLTIRLESDVVAVFRELAARRTLENGGAVGVTAQDVMRDWLNQHPACKGLSRAREGSKGVEPSREGKD